MKLIEKLNSENVLIDRDSGARKMILYSSRGSKGSNYSRSISWVRFFLSFFLNPTFQ